MKMHYFSFDHNYIGQPIRKMDFLNKLGHYEFVNFLVNGFLPFRSKVHFLIPNGFCILSWHSTYEWWLLVKFLACLMLTKQRCLYYVTGTLVFSSFLFWAKELDLKQILKDLLPLVEERLVVQLVHPFSLASFDLVAWLLVFHWSIILWLPS